MIGMNVFKKRERERMKFLNFFSFLIFLFVFSGVSVNSSVDIQNKGVGTFAGEAILLKSPDARSLALGDAYSSVVNGSESMYWNPAGLGRIQFMDVNLLGSTDDLDTRYSYGSYAFNINGFGTLGFSVSMIDYNEGFESTDKDANKIDLDINLQESVYSVGYGAAVPYSDEHLYFGMVLKTYTGEIVQEASVSLVDFGFLLDVPFVNFSFGMQNISIEKVKYNNVEEDLPANMRIGGSFESIGFLISVDGNYRVKGNREVYGNFGLEYRIPLGGVGVSLRGGYTTRNKEGNDEYEFMDGVRAGIGLDVFKKVRLDFAWIPNDNIGDALAISVSAGF